MELGSSSRGKAMRSQSRGSESGSSSSSTSSKSNAPLDLAADEEWQDIESDQETLHIASLFDNQIFSNIEETLTYTAEKWSCDVLDIVRRLGLDFYDCIKLINYIRTEVHAGNRKPDVDSKARFEDERYLHPVLEDDALLFSVDEILSLADSGRKTGVEQAGSALVDGQDTAKARVVELEEELAMLKSQFTQYRVAVERTLDDRWSDKDAGPDSARAVESTSKHPHDQRPKDPTKDDDAWYFNSYAYNSIHETMLKDTIRTSSYRDFIYSQKHLFAGKTVLDVGCGTSILSLFSAKAGAKRVFAVDNSNIITKAREIVAQNGLQDVVTCVRGMIEQVELPFPTTPNKPKDIVGGPEGSLEENKVDILVSEWMGYGLLFESMLDSVIHARDTHLHPTRGLMVPSHCTLHIAPVADSEYAAESGADFWRDVYGFDMSTMADASFYSDVIVRSPPKDALVSQSAVFRELSLGSIQVQDLSWEAEEREAGFEVVLEKDVESLDAWCVWFDTFFLPGVRQKLPVGARAEEWPRNDDSKGVAFTTGPLGQETHWYTALMMIDHENKTEDLGVGHPAAEKNSTPRDVTQGKDTKHRHHRKGRPIPLAKGQKITGCVGYKKRTSNARELEIKVRWEAPGTEERGRQVWLLR